MAFWSNFKKRLHCTFAHGDCCHAHGQTSSPAQSAVFNVASGDVPGIDRRHQGGQRQYQRTPRHLSCGGNLQSEQGRQHSRWSEWISHHHTPRLPSSAKGLRRTVIKRTSSNKVPMRLFHVSPSGNLILQKR